MYHLQSRYAHARNEMGFLTYTCICICIPLPRAQILMLISKYQASRGVVVSVRWGDGSGCIGLV